MEVLSANIALTDKEKEVLYWLCQDLLNKQIAGKMRISTKGVDFHKSNLLKKIGCFSSIGLVYYAYKNGLDKQNP